MMEQMKPYAKFKILGDVFLSPTDLQSLTLLYQPIMGVDAFSLYMLFLNLPKQTLQSHHLLLQMNGSDMNHLIETRQRLEATGLLDVYESDALMTYMLKQPLSVKRFFDDAIMRAFLSVKIGMRDYNVLKKMLAPEAISLIGDKTTKRFDEVFDIRTLSRFDQSIQFDRDRNSWEQQQGIEIATSFNASKLASILVKKGISQEIITPDLLKIVNELAFLYKFEEHELAYLVFDSSTPDGSVDFVKMKSLARMQFQLMSKGENVQVVVKGKQVKTKASTLEDSQQEFIIFLEQNPIDFLRFKSEGKPPVPADMKLVEWLYVDQGIPTGVINVLVDYVLNYTDGKLPKQLIEKIAGEWQRQGINTTQAAIDRVKKSLVKSSNYQKEKEKPIAKKKAPIAEALPDWFGKDYEQSRLSKQEAEVARQEIERIRREFLNDTR